jgi:hypothetical protein
MKNSTLVVMSLLALTGCGPQVGTIIVNCQPLVGVWNFVDGPAGPSTVSLSTNGTVTSYLQNSNLTLTGVWSFAQSLAHPVEGNLRIQWDQQPPLYLTNGIVVNSSLFNVVESNTCNSLSERYLGSE